MPKYSFICHQCGWEQEESFSVNQFLALKNKKRDCPNCGEGPFVQKISSIRASVEQSKEQIIMDIQDEVRKTVDKISLGDQRAIRDIYGDRPNPDKNKK